ncbi:MAG: hypothetical protein ACYC5M_05195, partial [Anaerolineae bacterium]
MKVRDGAGKPGYTRILSDAEIERIYAGVRRILLESGYRVQSEILLDRLEKRGARVDRARQVFWPSPEMLAAVEDCAR